MPIEIKELHILVTVNTQNHAEKVKSAAINENHAADKESMIAECVEQVMQILQHKAER